jgi:iron complex outermembrane recepter protein
LRPLNLGSMSKTSCLLFLLFAFSTADAQENLSDSSKTLEDVMIRAFEQNRKARFSTATVKIIDLKNADRNNKLSLVNGLNTVPGVRMEERSPGSYRLNIRGSSLRSPFGVRNVKVYWNEIPVTDPGGNTYFNQFAYNNFSTIEIYKGPAGSMYGAGTGGLVLMNTFQRWKPGLSLEYLKGSFNTDAVFASVRYGTNENRHQISYAHNQSDGYRIQSAMRRDNISWQTQLKLSGKQELSASLLYTDLYYQTPGALNLAEFTSNPKAARPAGGGFPSAVNAKAAIFQKTMTAGFTNAYQFNPHFKNTTTLYGAFAQIRNSAIRNYERRNEPGYGGRTVFVYNQETVTDQRKNSLQVVAGSEFQQGRFNTQVAKNRNGNPDTLQTNDDIDYTAFSVFLQGDLQLNQQWLFTAGISLNKATAGITRLSRYPVLTQKRNYRNELAPRFSLKKFITEDFSLKSTVSRGFSPPTVSELLPSTGVISTELEAEYGWNYEVTANYDFFNHRLQTELTVYYFRLNEALVQRRDLSGADFFVNAGDVRQQGIEWQTDYTQSFKKGVVDYFIFQAGYAYSHYRYGQFVKGADDFSGKTVPSVPSHTLSLLFDLQTRVGGYFNSTYYSASRIYLNDANTASADPYHLLGARLGWKKTWKQQYKLNFYAGADNLLNETYSLGNDINAAASRFYNAAPTRNYYVGLSLEWIKKGK